MKESLLNSTWNQLFKEYDILNKINTDGHYQIKAKSIKKYREARLVTKFDSYTQMPLIFKKNNLGIFPISREAYSIGRYNLFSLLETENSQVKTVDSVMDFQSLDVNNIDSESEAISIAYLSNIISDFINDDKLKPTVFGKKGVGSFEFKVKDYSGNIYSVNVEGGIMELDSCYESDQNFVIVEAKKSNPKDFLIRQLYFPYRHFYPKVSKKIRLLFLTYHENLFRLFEYKFDQLDIYNSIHLIQSKTYRISPIKLNKEDLIKILNATKIIQESKIPFPQADNLKRIFEICQFISNKGIRPKDIKNFQKFTLRQANYYLSAGLYLELFKKDDKFYSLSEIGLTMNSSKLETKYLILFKVLSKHSFFNTLFREILINNNKLSKDFVAAKFHNQQFYRTFKKSTVNRRISTSYSWIKEIIQSINKHNNI